MSRIDPNHHLPASSFTTAPIRPSTFSYRSRSNSRESLLAPQSLSFTPAIPIPPADLFQPPPPPITRPPLPLSADSEPLSPPPAYSNDYYDYSTPFAPPRSRSAPYLPNLAFTTATPLPPSPWPTTSTSNQLPTSPVTSRHSSASLTGFIEAHQQQLPKHRRSSSSNDQTTLLGAAGAREGEDNEALEFRPRRRRARAPSEGGGIEEPGFGSSPGLTRTRRGSEGLMMSRARAVNVGVGGLEDGVEAQLPVRPLSSSQKIWRNAAHVLSDTAHTPHGSLTLFPPNLTPLVPPLPLSPSSLHPPRPLRFLLLIPPFLLTTIPPPSILSLLLPLHTTNSRAFNPPRLVHRGNVVSRLRLF
ncbi:hypothetical protein P7C70_g7058, partial [Phenoliferia sp. Uapishka_3]